MSESPIATTHLPLFEVFTPEGHCFRIHADGLIEGFPEGSFISNGIVPSIHATLGLLRKARNNGDIPEELLSHISSIWKGTF